MDDLFYLINDWCEQVYNFLVLPLLMAIAHLLAFLLSPLSNYPPKIQIVCVAVAGAVISRLLSWKFKSKKQKMLNAKFKEKLSHLKYVSDIPDEKLKKVFKKGISEEADKIYENILIDQLTDMGISYFFPLFFFLIWLEYYMFTPAKLMAATGIKFAWITKSGLKLSAAWLYLYCFNLFVFTFWAGEFLIKFALKRIKQQKGETR